MKGLYMIVFLIFILSLLGCVDILSVKENELSVIEVPNKPYKLRIVYVASNATVQPSIQVRKIYEKKEELLQDYERYNYLESYKLLSDTALMIVVKDTSSYFKNNRLDTMIVKLK